MKFVKLNLILLLKITPFPVSPTGEKIESGFFSYFYKIGNKFVQLLPPWGKAGKGVKFLIGEHSINKIGL
jgi:hypothetical protein